MAPRHRARVAVLAALGAALLVLGIPALAAAHTYVVNSTGDAPEPMGCESVPEEECTLRGAIEASDANPPLTAGQNLINFDSGFEGVAGSDEIELTKPLEITKPVAIAGNSCRAPATQIAMPCVGVVGLAGAAADFIVESNEVSFYDLAIGGGEVGIDAVGGAGLQVGGSWFGMNLAQQARGLSKAGIVLDSDFAALIGQDGDGPHPQTEEELGRNVFAHSKVGISMIGASHATVEGNYIGVGPDGATLAGVSVGVQIVDASHPAEENLIGGELTEIQAGSRSCDGPCNVIATSGPGAVGIQLADESGGTHESPSGPTGIYGNYIGLSADGGTQVGEASYDILAAPTPGATVGPADVSVGGPRAPESDFSPFRNIIDGGAVAVRVDRAEGFLAEENLIGHLPADNANLEPGPDQAGFELLPGGVTERPVVARNAIILRPAAIGVITLGAGSQILVNTIYFGFTSIIAAGDDGGKGNLVHGNLIDEPQQFGIEVENDSNVLTGNWIFEAGRGGIVLGGENGVYASHNRVGGDSADEENRIEGCPEGAIQIFGEPSDHNEVAGNWGTSDFEPGVGHAFIQLIGHSSAEPPNDGIEPPTVGLAEESKASGTAEPGAKVRIFTKRTADPGELQSPVATAVADSTGHWTAGYAKVLIGTLIAATQTNAAGTPEAATSEVSAAKAAVADREETGGGGDTGGGATGAGPSGSAGTTSPTPSPAPTPAPVAPRSTAPRVKLLTTPKKTSEATKATFKFKAEPAAAATFECKLDGAKWAKCASPKTYKGLKGGRHTFRVRVRAAGLTGPAAKFQFTIKP